jgi:hypothetical protein
VFNNTTNIGQGLGRTASAILAWGLGTPLKWVKRKRKSEVVTLTTSFCGLVWRTSSFSASVKLTSGLRQRVEIRSKLQEIMEVD